jgi:predicted  nucleic acid-binding Zn-ribbon protein
MHAFRCTRCGAASYSAASLELLSAGDRCSHCGGELVKAREVRHFSAARSRRGETVAASRRAELRRSA